MEAGCDFELVAPDVGSAVEGAQRHIAEAHSSFELEEMIEDVLEDSSRHESGPHFTRAMTTRIGLGYGRESIDPLSSSADGARRRSPTRNIGPEGG